MEFNLNKIDPEVRRRVKETTRAGKVHNKTGIFINKDYKDKENRKQGDFQSQLKKYKQGKSKKRIFVEASKVEKVEIKAFKEEENICKNDGMGTILDVKK